MDSAPPPPDPIAATAAAQAAAALLDDALLFDLEATPDGRILAIGAEFRGQCFLREGRLQVGAVLAELAGFAHGARLVLGHNLLDHDWPLLRAQAPQAAILRLPVLDTLYLSPLAFPENPYHALVKDYKLVRDSVNDPVADARLAGRVFLEQVAAFAARAQGGPDWADLLRYAWTDAAAGRDGLSPTAFLWLWERLGGRPPADPGALIERLIDARTCRSRRSAALQPLLMQPGLRPLLGYLVTWLMVAGGNSVLPAWLRHRFPALPEAVRRLRDEPCSDPACAWCRDAHDPRGQLERWFGFPDFRAEPATAEGGSLQRAIVAAGLGHDSLLGILPTGGGKSLCYQVPALARYRNRGALTVVISPLRALMKDQVDGLNRRVGFELCGALYGDLTPPERGALIERVQLGDIAVLYVAPEQFRNASFRSLLESREIGAWVFDEAHCLSQWGHDFRPDYLYCARFIREFGERHKLPLAPVSAVTATAKPDVIDEIRRHFREELGLELTLYAGGVERDNLRFEVRAVTSASKPAQVLQLLRERLEPAPGAAIVYCAKQDSTVEFARFLDSEGWAAEAFHGGMKAPDKRSVQERFLAGELRVICATNAFGMGIDKPDVRLVIHADAPSSLEHYLQEAGRAGRDREPADCVLLYAPEDIERQFRWGARSRLSRQDIAGILRALRRMQQKRDADEPVVVTAGELLRSDSLLTGFETEDADTRVRTALAWLEKAQLVERNENRTGVFQGRPSVGSMAEARAKLDALDLAPRARRRWEAVLAVLLQTDADDGLSVDTLAQLPALRPGPDEKPVPVLRLLDDMHRAGLLQLGLQLTAWLRPKGAGRERGAMSRFEQVSAIESALIRLLSETAPDAGGEEWPLHLRPLNQRLLDEGLPSDPELLRKLLKSLSLDGIGLAARKPSLTLRALGREWLRVRLRRTWSAIGETSELRRALAQRLLQTLLARVPADAPQQDLLLVDFALEDLRTALKADALLANRISDPLAAIERALLYLHEQQVITLQQGLAVFRSAMTLRVPPEARGRRYTVGDYALLDAHYHARTLQVHVMAEYARLALARITQALELVGAYFTLGQKAFLRRYFAGREQELKIQTSPESFRAIVEALGNPAQQAIVAAGDETNLLVLAGPGAGKSRVVVHRVAYLLRVRRVPPQAVLVLCYNRNAALELRRRLTALVGAEARGVTVQTFHGLALALSGHALDGRRRARTSNGNGEGDGDGDGIDFEALLAEATALLRGEREQIGVPGDELRERLLAGYRHILVDEYQDIDAAQYELVAAIAGRTLEDPDRKLTLLAVGDDDQNIYDFRFTSTAFIRRFSEDYGGETHFLTENYRSTRHIIDAANTLIAHNRERMKADQPIRP
ncbi:MAG TPA: RecQ family ATP-dependent DNA helicase, partial [Plasticicumulans sp.]|nr:RecQ family ATP-dependent DNA helicase [Plasticicumulans sp.]